MRYGTAFTSSSRKAVAVLRFAFSQGVTRSPAKHVLADAAYDSETIRSRIRRMKARACIKPHTRRKRRRRYDKQRYKHRNVIERFFRRIKQCRRVATRYEKKAANFASFVWLAAFITGGN